MANLRQLENKTGISRDASEITILYAEDWNEMKAKINDGADSINTSAISIAGDETIDANRVGIFAKVKDDYNGYAKFICKGTLDYNDTTFQTILTLPANAVLFNIYVNVTSEFDGSAVLDVGTTSTNNRYLDDLSITSTGWKTLSLTNVPDKMSAETSIGGIISGTPTQGELEVYFEYAIF